MKMLFKQIVLAKSSHRLLCWLDSDFLSKGMRTRSAAKYNWLGYKIEHIKVHTLVSCSAGNHLKLITTWLGITDWIIWWGHWRYAPEIVKIVNVVNMMEIVKNLPSKMEVAPPPSNSVIKLKMFSQKVSSKLLTWIHNVLRKIKDLFDNITETELALFGSKKLLWNFSCQMGELIRAIHQYGKGKGYYWLSEKVLLYSYVEKPKPQAIATNNK